MQTPANSRKQYDSRAFWDTKGGVETAQEQLCALEFQHLSTADGQP